MTTALWQDYFYGACLLQWLTGEEGDTIQKWREHLREVVRKFFFLSLSMSAPQHHNTPSDMFALLLDFMFLFPHTSFPALAYSNKAFTYKLLPQILFLENLSQDIHYVK